MAHLNSEEDAQLDTNDKKDKNWFNNLIDIISGIFQPILIALSAAGVIKGFNTLFVSLNWYSQNTGTYAILNAIGDAMFMFLPIILGFSAAKKIQIKSLYGINYWSCLMLSSCTTRCII